MKDLTSGVARISTPASTPNVHPIALTTVGNVTEAGITLVAPFSFPKNAVQSYGGPWTTDKVTVRAGPEIFHLQGTDDRVDGLGSISLVAGGVSARSLSGLNADRGWHNWTVSAVRIPAISFDGLVLLTALLVAVTTWISRRAVAVAVDR